MTIQNLLSDAASKAVEKYQAAKAAGAGPVGNVKRRHLVAAYVQRLAGPMAGTKAPHEGAQIVKVSIEPVLWVEAGDYTKGEAQVCVAAGSSANGWFQSSDWRPLAEVEEIERATRDAGFDPAKVPNFKTFAPDFRAACAAKEAFDAAASAARRAARQQAEG